MPSIEFVAPLLRQTIATLRAKLPDQIGIYNAEPANEVDLVEPTDFVFGAMDTVLLTAGPVIEVAAVSGQTAKAAIDYTEFDHYPAVTVVVWHEGERGELPPTYEMSLGLARCAIEVLTRPGAFGDAVELRDDPGAVTWRTDVLPADPAADGREFNKWQCAVLITFQVETVERFS